MFFGMSVTLHQHPSNFLYLGVGQLPKLAGKVPTNGKEAELANATLGTAHPAYHWLRLKIPFRAPLVGGRAP